MVCKFKYFREHFLKPPTDRNVQLLASHRKENVKQLLLLLLTKKKNNQKKKLNN